MLEILAQVAIFQSISSDGLAQLTARGTKQVFPAGTDLMVQGDIANSLHVILSGSVRIVRTHPQLTSPLELAVLGPGEVVGEMGVLDREPRSATVTAVEDTETMELSRDVLAQTLLLYPDTSGALLRVLSRRLRSTDELAEQERWRLAQEESARATERQRMLDELSRVFIFREISPNGLSHLADQGEPRTFPAGSVLMRQGDASESMHVIVSGLVRVTRAHARLPEPLVLADLGPGEIVGEMGVLERAPRSATVTAIEDTETIELNRLAFAGTMLMFPDTLAVFLRLLSRRLRSNDAVIDQVLDAQLGKVGGTREQ